MSSKITYEQITQFFPKYLSEQISKEQYQNSQTEIKTVKKRLAIQKLIIRWFIKQIRNRNKYYKKNQNQDPNKRQSISKIFLQLNKIISKYKKRKSKSEKDKYMEIFFNQQNQQFSRSNRIFMSSLIFDEQKLTAIINRKYPSFNHNRVHYIKILVKIGIEFKQDYLCYGSEQKLCKDYLKQNNQNIKQEEQQINQEQQFKKYIPKQQLTPTYQFPSSSDSYPNMDLQSYPTPTFEAIPIIQTGEFQSQYLSQQKPQCD